MELSAKYHAIIEKIGKLVSAPHSKDVLVRSVVIIFAVLGREDCRLLHCLLEHLQRQFWLVGRYFMP